MQTNFAEKVTADWSERLRSFEQETILRVRHGDIVWEGSNRADLPKNGAANEAQKIRGFRTASLTKTFTAALAFRLWEEGQLELDANIEKYIPIELYERIQKIESRFGETKITVRHLLDHKSGLYDYATDAGFIADIAANPKRQWSPIELVEVALKSGIHHFAPGIGLSYSDTSYVLLGMIIERCCDAPLAQAYRDHLLRPLDLKFTYLEGREEAVQDIVVSEAYADTVNVANFDPSFDNFGGGGLVSTAADLDTFISELFGGGVYANVGSLSAMLEGTVSPTGTGTRKTLTSCGISEFEISGKRLWGHLGHWNSFMFHLPSADFSVCGSFNQSRSHPDQIALMEAVVDGALKSN